VWCLDAPGLPLKAITEDAVRVYPWWANHPGTQDEGGEGEDGGGVQGEEGGRAVTYLNGRFRVVPGLSNMGRAGEEGRAVEEGKEGGDKGEMVSFEDVNRPGHYLRHYSYVLRCHYRDYERSIDDQFSADATFRDVPGLAESSTHRSFESGTLHHMYLIIMVHMIDYSPSRPPTAPSNQVPYIILE
jgi:hypothetical protein